MKKQLKPLTPNELRDVAKKLREAQEILEPIYDKLVDAYGRTSVEKKHIFTVLNILSCKLCNELDNRFCSIPETITEKSPFFGGKKGWV